MKQFAIQVKNILLDSGFFENSHGYKFSKQTRFGKLNVSVYEEKSKIYSVFMVFDNFTNEEEFLKLFSNIDFNIYSHKWNIHKHSAIEVVNELKNRFSKL